MQLLCQNTLKIVLKYRKTSVSVENINEFFLGNNYLISGKELLDLALDKINFVQNEIGGKFTYLECQDNSKLIKFYEDNGFTKFGKRQLDRDETDIDGEHLIQMFKYLSHK